jgi:hypothetical protein
LFLASEAMEAWLSGMPMLLTLTRFQVVPASSEMETNGKPQKPRGRNTRPARSVATCPCRPPQNSPELLTPRYAGVPVFTKERPPSMLREQLESLTRLKQ